MATSLAQRNGKAHEKSSNFAQTFILLSQYVKERGNSGGISLGINRKSDAKGFETSRSSSPATTLNLLPNMENNSAEYLRQKAVASTNVTTADFFPQLLGFASPNPIEEGPINKADNLKKSSTTVPGNAPMTIFYGGKVIVFDDFPADKAKEIMALAGKAISTNNPNGKINNSANSAASVSNNAPDRLQLLQPQVATVSLHRFFAKRKERVAARAPYRINNSLHAAAAPPKGEEKTSNPWLDLEGQATKQLELKL